MKFGRVKGDIYYDHALDMMILKQSRDGRDEFSFQKWVIRDVNQDSNEIIFGTSNTFQVTIKENKAKETPMLSHAYAGLPTSGGGDHHFGKVFVIKNIMFSFSSFVIWMSSSWSLLCTNQL